MVHLSEPHKDWQKIYFIYRHVMDTKFAWKTFLEIKSIIGYAFVISDLSQKSETFPHFSGSNKHILHKYKFNNVNIGCAKEIIFFNVWCL